MFGLVDAHCSTLLGDSALLAALNASQFTVAVVDLIANECSLAVAHRLNIPVVGYWGFPFQGGEVSLQQWEGEKLLLYHLWGVERRQRIRR